MSMTLRKTFSHGGMTYSVDSEVFMKHSVTGKRELIAPYYFNGTYINSGFVWNGASSPSTPIARLIAPKFYKNVKASLVHDWLCSLARNRAERAHADYIYYLMKRYVEEDLEIFCKASYAGVRIGALFGKGNNF